MRSVVLPGESMLDGPDVVVRVAELGSSMQVSPEDPAYYSPTASMNAEGGDPGVRAPPVGSNAL